MLARLLVIVQAAQLGLPAVEWPAESAALAQRAAEMVPATPGLMVAEEFVGLVCMVVHLDSY